MEIFFLGALGLMIKGKNETVLVDAGLSDSEKIKSRVLVYTSGSFSVDDLVKLGEKVVVRGVGEYEIGGVSIVGVGNGLGRTAYKIEVDGSTVGVLGEKMIELKEKKMEKLEGIDVLVASVAIESKELKSLAKKLGVNYLVPVGYEEAEEEKMKTFLDFFDQEGLVAVPSLKIDRSVLPEGMEIVLLKKMDSK